MVNEWRKALSLRIGCVVKLCFYLFPYFQYIHILDTVQCTRELRSESSGRGTTHANFFTYLLFVRMRLLDHEAKGK